MHQSRFIHSILQSLLALLLLLAGPYHANLPVQHAHLAETIGAELVVLDAQPHKGAVNSEPERQLAGAKRNVEPNPTGLSAAEHAWVEPSCFAEQGQPPLTFRYVAQRRPCAAPPTGPPTS